MSELSLTVWLLPGVLLLVWGVVAAGMAAGADDRGQGIAGGVVLMLGGLVLSLAALVRHAVLPPAAMVTLGETVALTVVLLLVAVFMGNGKDAR